MIAEFERSRANKSLYILFGLIFLIYVLAYLMPLGLDKTSHLSYRAFMMSVYTVFTQFGPMLFPFLIAFSINKDYADKTGLFYRLIGVNSLRYWLTKIGAFALELLACLLVYNLLVSLFYRDFSALIQMTLLTFLVSLSTFCLVGIFALIFSNLILAIGISLAFWVLGIVLAQVGGIFKYLAFFDSSSKFYGVVGKYLNSQVCFIQQGFWQPVIYTGLVFVAGMLVSYLLKKRFFRLGVEG